MLSLRDIAAKINDNDEEFQRLFEKFELEPKELTDQIDAGAEGVLEACMQLMKEHNEHWELQRFIEHGIFIGFLVGLDYADALRTEKQLD